MLTINTTPSGAYLRLSEGLLIGPIVNGKPAITSQKTYDCGTLIQGSEQILGDKNVTHYNIEGVLHNDTAYDYELVPENWLGSNSPGNLMLNTARRVMTTSKGTSIFYPFITSLGQDVYKTTKWSNEWLRQRYPLSFNGRLYTPKVLRCLVDEHFVVMFSYSHDDVIKHSSNLNGLFSQDAFDNEGVSIHIFIPYNYENWDLGGAEYILSAFAPGHRPGSMDGYPWNALLQKWWNDPLGLAHQCLGNIPNYLILQHRIPSKDLGLIDEFYWVSYNKGVEQPVLKSTEVRRLGKLLRESNMSKTVIEHTNNFSKLSTRVINNTKSVDVNSIAFLKDLTSIRQLLPPIPTGGLKGAIKPKYLANLLLWWKYGVENTLRDIISYGESAANAAQKSERETPYMTSRAKYVVTFDEDTLAPGQVEYRGKLRYSRYDQKWMQLRTHLDDLGLYPTAIRGWDLVPYSFVIDWVLPIGDLLAQFDVYTDVQYIDIWCYTKSKKITKPVYVHSLTYLGMNLSGLPNVVTYVRVVQNYCDLPVTLPEFPAVNPSAHWLEGAALVISRGKK